MRSIQIKYVLCKINRGLKLQKASKIKEMGKGL